MAKLLNTTQISNRLLAVVKNQALHEAIPSVLSVLSYLAGSAAQDPRLKNLLLNALRGLVAKLEG